MKKHNGRFLMITGLLLLAAAFAYAAMNISEEQQADVFAQQALSQLQMLLPTTAPSPTPAPAATLTVQDEKGQTIPVEELFEMSGDMDATDSNTDSTTTTLSKSPTLDKLQYYYIADDRGHRIPWPKDEDGTPMTWDKVLLNWDALVDPGLYLVGPTEEPLFMQNPDIEMPVVSLNDELYIGVLDIPSLDISLPVMSKWTYPRLKTAPCRYKGSAYSGDLIICGHNYERHFGQLKTMQKGDTVRFTDTEGNVFVYAVAYLDDINKYDIARMNAGSWDLTLFTCTKGGKTRMTVRCKLVETIPN